MSGACTDPAGIERELERERAAALGRIGRRLEAAVEEARARAAELAACSPEEAAAAERRFLAARAVARRWLWYYLVQREACGLRHHHAVLATYRLPGDPRCLARTAPASG